MVNFDLFYFAFIIKENTLPFIPWLSLDLFYKLVASVGTNRLKTVLKFWTTVAHQLLFLPFLLDEVDQKWIYSIYVICRHLPRLCLFIVSNQCRLTG